MQEDTVAAYLAFAEEAARARSPTYERLARAVASSQLVVARLETLPELKRQPNLLFGVARLLGGPITDPEEFTGWVEEHWDAVEVEIRSRRTQTNEPGRLSVLMPIMATLPQPLALVEVGAAAGLCLYPDRWQYRYDALDIGDGSQPTLSCTVTGPWSPPSRLPQIVWRAGIDLRPLDVTSADDTAWLQALIWPEHQQRRDRLKAALRIAEREPPQIVTGDLIDSLHDLVARAPRDATLVVFHSAVIAYLDMARRAEFTRLLTDVPGHWISNEGPRVLPEIADTIPAGSTPGNGRFLAALDGQAVAWSGGHGESIEWLARQA